MQRVNVQFSDSVYAALKELADTQGKSMACILRDAISLEKYVRDAVAGGGTVFVRKGDGSLVELMIR